MYSWCVKLYWHVSVLGSGFSLLFLLFSSFEFWSSEFWSVESDVPALSFADVFVDSYGESGLVSSGLVSSLFDYGFLSEVDLSDVVSVWITILSLPEGFASWLSVFASDVLSFWSVVPGFVYSLVDDDSFTYDLSSTGLGGVFAYGDESVEGVLKLDYDGSSFFVSALGCEIYV